MKQLQKITGNSASMTQFTHLCYVQQTGQHKVTSSVHLLRSSKSLRRTVGSKDQYLKCTVSSSKLIDGSVLDTAALTQTLTI